MKREGSFVDRRLAHALAWLLMMFIESSDAARINEKQSRYMVRSCFEGALRCSKSSRQDYNNYCTRRRERVIVSQTSLRRTHAAALLSAHDAMAEETRAAAACADKTAA